MSEGKLYICAVEDVYSGRIVGYCIDSRMKSRLAVTALHNAVARRGEVAGCIVHTDHGSRFRSKLFIHEIPDGRVDGQGRSRGRQRRDGELLQPAATQRPGPASVDQP
ncbi:DDE-type integrase/transposase/recombinase [Nocardia asteroides]|nr:DDE-type integrase/transposase/recombinase [Nocardia asteroides]